jgi:hypothetical protein
VTQILRLAVALIEPRENAEDLVARCAPSAT